MSDHGRTLALTLTDEYLAEVEGTMEKVRATLDHDEGGAGFHVGHNEHCPAGGWMTARGSCACGLTDMIDGVQHALATLRTAREQVRTLREAR